MSSRASADAAIQPARGWEELLARLERGTVLVVGEPGSGKSTLAHYLLAQLGRGLGRVGLVDCDPGQGRIGPPGCLGLALTAPWRAPAACWFVGDTTPSGHLLPMVVGATHLARRAREDGARVVILDSSGLMDGATGRALLHHTAIAAGVDQVVAIQRDDALEPLLALLAAPGRAVHRLAVSPLARRGGRGARRDFRDRRFRAHLAGAATRLFSPRRLVGTDWVLGGLEADGSGGGNGGGNGHHPVGNGHAAGRDAGRGLAPGTVVGLLDERGFCLGLGRLEEVHADRVAVATSVPRDGVERLQLGRFRLSEEGSQEIATVLDGSASVGPTGEAAMPRPGDALDPAAEPPPAVAADNA